VVRIGRQEGEGYGLFVRVQGFIDGQPLESLYAHLEYVSVEEGAWVRRGYKIGEVGQRGTTWPHLYFELRWMGALVDPILYMEVEGDEDTDIGCNG
jgi:murein DD-endopeptidase MepM/ murein hydrolase activator NlpD